MLDGVRALVTGATSGIGEAIAARFVLEGAYTVISARRLPAGAELAQRLSDLGPGRCEFIAADLGTPHGPLELAKAAEQSLGGVEVLVNNAGISFEGLTPDITVRQLDEMFRLNFRGAYLLSTALMPRMAERGHGVVVNITSAAANRGYPGIAASGASKAALESLTRSWASEFGRRGIRVVAVSPGAVLTPATGITPEELARFCTLYGLGRYGAVDEVASAVAFIVSPRARYIHGTTVHVDGGMVQTLDLAGRQTKLARSSVE